MSVFSFAAVTAMCQKMESGSATIDGKPASPKPAVVNTKAYSGYVAPAASPKPATPAEEAKKPLEKTVVLPTGGNLGTTTTAKANQKAEPAAKVQGTSLEPKAVTPVVENKQVVPGPSSTDPALKKAGKVGSN